MVDSGQYKVTGLTFSDSYSITYKIEDIVYNETYPDPAFYFGWMRNDIDKSDDSFKLSSGDGTMATWIWGSGGIADLSINDDHGWHFNVWYNAPGSVSNFEPLTGDHYLTFERFVDKVNNKATYGIKYDFVPFTFLEIGENYTDTLLGVWIESVNTEATISVYDYQTISDDVAPTLQLAYSSYRVGQLIDLKNGATIEDNGDYGHLIVPRFTVVNESGEEVDLTGTTFRAIQAGTYTVTCSIKDIAGNQAQSTTTLVVSDPLPNTALIDLDDTSAAARVGTGIVLYYEATFEEERVLADSIKILKGNNPLTAVDVSNNVLKVVQSPTDPTKKFDVFTPNEPGTYLYAVTVNEVTEYKSIEATYATSSIYNFDFYENNFSHITIGRDMVIYDGVEPNELTGKLGYNLPRASNWTLSFDVTDLSYSAKGKLGFVIAAQSSSGSFGGWEDLTIGGNINDDLWGYETATVGVGWQTYQWRSNWQNPTDEFLPDPSDPSIGCGRESTAYSDYAFGTHSYKIVCSTNQAGQVTYTFYIDDQIEVVHNLPIEHDGINATDFLQIWSNSMNGIVTNIKIK